MNLPCEDINLSTLPPPGFSEGGYQRLSKNSASAEKSPLMAMGQKDSASRVESVVSPFKVPIAFLGAVGKKEIATVILSKNRIYKTDNKQFIKSAREEIQGVSGNKQGWVKLQSGSKILKTAYEAVKVVQSNIYKAWKDKKIGDRVNAPFILATIHTSGDIPPLASMVNTFSEGFSEGDPALQTTGLKFISALSVISGALIIVNASNSLKQAKLIGDIEGIKEAKLRIGRGVLEISLGFVAGGLRTVGALSLQESSKALVIWNTTLGYVSTAIGSALYTLLSIPFVKRARGSHKLLQELGAIINLKEESNPVKIEKALQFLIGQLALNDQDYDSVLDECKPKTETEFYNHITEYLLKDPESYCEKPLEEHLDEELKEIAETKPKAGAKLTKEEMLQLERRGHAYIEEVKESGEYTAVLDWCVVEKAMLSMAAENCLKLKQRKEASFQRVSGFESLAAIKKEIEKPQEERLYTRLKEVLEEVQENGVTTENQSSREIISALKERNLEALADRLESVVQESEKTIKTVHGEAKKQKILSILIVATCIIGILAMIVSTVFSSGLVPIIIGVVMALVTSGLMLKVDFEELVHKFRTMKTSGYKDKLILGLIMAISTASIALGVYFTASLAAMILVLVAGVIILGIQGTAVALACRRHNKDSNSDQNRDIARGLPAADLGAGGI